MEQILNKLSEIAQRPQDRPEQKCAGDRRFRQRQDEIFCETQPHAVWYQKIAFNF